MTDKYYNFLAKQEIYKKDGKIFIQIIHCSVYIMLSLFSLAKIDYNPNILK